MFTSCGKCGQTIVVCAEEGSVFSDPRATDCGDVWSMSADTGTCPNCTQEPVAEFGPATAEAIQALGFSPQDYE